MTRSTITSYKELLIMLVPWKKVKSIKITVSFALLLGFVVWQGSELNPNDLLQVKNRARSEGGPTTEPNLGGEARSSGLENQTIKARPRNKSSDAGLHKQAVRNRGFLAGAKNLALKRQMKLLQKHLDPSAPNICQGYVTVLSGGRLGNKVGEYATLLGFQRKFKTRAYIDPAHHGELIKLFPDLSIPPLTSLRCRGWGTIGLVDEHSYQGLKETEDVFRVFGADNLAIRVYVNDLHVFHPIKSELVREFRVCPKVQTLIQRNLAQVNQIRQLAVESIFVGVHIRLTDYIQFIKSPLVNGFPVSKHYFRRAMDVFRRQLGSSVIFIVASDDWKTVKEFFPHRPDVYYTHDMDHGSTDPALFDFATLTAMNHSIMSYGTFGFYTSYLAGGQVIAADAYHGGLANHFSLPNSIISNGFDGGKWRLVADPSLNGTNPNGPRN